MSRKRKKGPNVYGKAEITSRGPSFNIKELYAQLKQCICVSYIALKTNSDHFPRTTLTIFITGTYCVYCAVRAVYLIMYGNFSS